jgi:flagellar motor component MotA
MDMQSSLLLQSLIFLKHLFQEERKFVAKYICLMKSNHWQNNVPGIMQASMKHDEEEDEEHATCKIFVSC